MDPPRAAALECALWLFGTRISLDPKLGGGQESGKNFLSFVFQGPELTPFAGSSKPFPCPAPTSDSSLAFFGCKQTFGSVHFSRGASGCQWSFVLHLQEGNLEKTLLLLIHLATLSMICMYPSLFSLLFFFFNPLSSRHEKKPNFPVNMEYFCLK